jgi:hypothetical protein
MLKSSDLIRLPYPAELTQAGIAIASRKLASGRISGKSIDIRQLRLEVVQASVRLAFPRYLLDRRIPFQYQEYKPFSQPEQASVVLGGRKCEIETSLITGLNTAGQLSQSIEQLLETSIRIPAGMQTSDLYSAGDLAVFAFAVAGVTDDRSGLLHAAEAGEPFLCNHVMPEAWRQPRRRMAPGQLSFRCAGDASIVLDLYGLGSQQEPLVEQMAVYPQTWVTSRYQYSSLSCVQAGAIPSARIEMRSPARHSAYTIMPLQWRNLWVYGQEIILAGYLTIEEIWDMARAAPVKPLAPPPDLDVPAASLHSLPAYLAQVAARHPQIRKSSG